MEREHACRLTAYSSAALRNDKINYKVHEHSLARVPVLLVVGRKGVETRQISIRRLGSGNQLDASLAALADEAAAGYEARTANLRQSGARALAKSST